MSDKGCMTSREELAQKALEHYEELWVNGASWNSVIPNAIETWRVYPELIKERDEARAWARKMMAERDAQERRGNGYLLSWHRDIEELARVRDEHEHPRPTCGIKANPDNDSVQVFPQKDITAIDIDYVIDIINAEIKRIFKDEEDPFSQGYVFGGHTWYIFKGLEKARDLLVGACRKPNK